jgi:hypothetical protein
MPGIAAATLVTLGGVTIVSRSVTDRYYFCLDGNFI